MKAALLINPHAGGNRRSSVRRHLRDSFAALGQTVEVDDPRCLPAVLGWLRDRGTELLAISGGDGTLHSVVNAAVRAWSGAPLPRLLPLHGGTVGIASRAMSRTDQLARVRALGRAAGPWIERPIHTLRVGEQVAFNFGIGAFATLGRASAARGGGRRGLARLAVRAVGSTVLGGGFAREAFAPWSGRVLVDGHLVVGAIGGLYGSALDRNALGPLRGFYRVGQPDGRFRVLRIGPEPRSALRSLVPFALGAGRGVDPRITLRPAGTVELVPDGPSVVLLDGEPTTFDRPLTVTAGPVLWTVCPDDGDSVQ